MKVSYLARRVDLDLTVTGENREDNLITINWYLLVGRIAVTNKVTVGHQSSSCRA